MRSAPQSSQHPHASLELRVQYCTLRGLYLSLQRLCLRLQVLLEQQLTHPLTQVWGTGQGMRVPLPLSALKLPAAGQWLYPMVMKGLCVLKQHRRLL